MPGGSNKYSVQTTNRFAIDAGDSSSSEDEAVSNVDPFQLIKKAETDAVKKTKEQLKAAAKKAKEPAPKKPEVAEEKKEDRPAKRNNRNREPRGNQQQRRGPRNERKRPDGEAGGDVAEKKDAPLGENNDNRRRRERRPKDRESGNPRTGVRAQEKKGGAGKGNWGKADKNYDADAPAAEEKPTPEESPAEPVEKKEGEEANAEEQENKEPEEQAPPTLTLEEYMASLGSVDAPKNLRKANDGEELKGNTFRSNKIHAEKQPVYASSGTEKHSNKNYIAPENLAFISRGDKGGFFYTDSRDNDRRRGGGRGEGGDRRRGGKGRDNNQNSGPKEFSLKADQDFPSLGGKVAAK